MDGCMQLECIKPLHKLFFSLISFVPGWMDGCPCDTCIKPWHKLFFSLISFVPGWMDGWMDAHVIPVSNLGIHCVFFFDFLLSLDGWVPMEYIKPFA
jgi:hypothetical protein